MKKIQLYVLMGVGVALAIIAFNVWPETYLHPTLEGTNLRDYDKPSLIIKDNGTIKQTIPGTEVEDYSVGGYVRSDDGYKRTLPGSDMIDPYQGGYTYD